MSETRDVDRLRQPASPGHECSFRWSVNGATLRCSFYAGHKGDHEALVRVTHPATEEALS